ncbi:Vitamin K-dependent protein C [Minicystis rosea]|nr:Vitamin K-dependent protein C [Minicystis rosea]
MLGSLSSACAPIEAPAGEAASPIIGGAETTDDTGTVTILIKKPNYTKPFEWCSGAMVSPHVVVTAAHCLAKTPDDVPEGATLSIFSGAVYDYAGPKPAASLFFSIKETQIVPDYTDATAPSQGRDLGVVITDEPLPGTPYRMIDGPLDDSLVGETVRLVGSGANVLPSEDTYSTGTRKRLELPVTSLEANYIHEQGDAGSTCNGDSGGPTLWTRQGVELLIGIHAATVGFPACTGANYDTRLDLYATSFVTPFVEANDPGFLMSAGGGGGGGAGGAATGERPPSLRRPPRRGARSERARGPRRQGSCSSSVARSSRRSEGGEGANRANALRRSRGLW